ncbi:uncharacterized protein LOC9655387 [Selaginella moellendorffii]|nr:uncharacterized protein LOC9655387 [Selaginella moellendorffii]|eukprot:XP_002965466.2 uncharacterized protein LOC9655387 [Selaginella moellendorffii]
MAPAATQSAKIARPAPSIPKSNSIGSYSFTRSASSGHDSLGAAKSDASSCTSVFKKPESTADTKTRRVLSDISNFPGGVALPEQHSLSTPRKLSVDVDSHGFGTAATRYEDSQLKRNSSLPGKAIAPITTALRCGGKSLSKGTTPVAECILKTKVQAHPKKKPRDDAITPLQWSRSPPSKLSTLRKKILDKVAGKSIVKPKNQVQRRSISKDREFRRLSMVIRSEEELLEKSKAYEEKLQLLQQQCVSKESEIESVRNVGKMLGKLCVNQAEELKALKGMFPPTLREVVQLRDVCQKQEKELRDARTVVPSLQEQVKLLTAQLDSLADDIEKVKAARLARRALTCDVSTKSAVESASTEPIHPKQDHATQPGSVTTSMTEANLEALMQRMNLTSAEEKDLSALEEKCASAFRDLEKFRPS